MVSISQNEQTGDFPGHLGFHAAGSVLILRCLTFTKLKKVLVLEKY